MSEVIAQKIKKIEEEICTSYGEKLASALGKNYKQEIPPIVIEFEWASFNELFQSLINEGAQEVIETILDSLVSKHCAVALLSTLLSHCKEPEQASVSSQFRQSVSSSIVSVSKREQIRSFLQAGFRKYKIKYSDDPREWGFYDAKTKTLCDVVEIDVTDQEEINWIFRDITKNIEKCTELQQYIIQNYYIPEYEARIKQCFQNDIKLTVNWDSIDYAAQDYGKAVYTIYHDRSAMVLEEILRAFEYISTYEDDALLDAMQFGLTTVGIALQPGEIGIRKDFDIDEKNCTVTLRMCLEAAEYTGVFRANDLVPIFKLCGIYDTELTPIFKMELLSSAAKTFNVAKGDLSLFIQVLNRKDLDWWNGTSESQRHFLTITNLETCDNAAKLRYEEYMGVHQKEQIAIDACVKFIEQYYKQRIETWNKQQKIKHQSEDSSQEGALISEDDDLHQEFEKLIKAWHVVKFNKQNLHQERFLLLTNRAYWTFKFDFIKKKVDEQHYKRHDLVEFQACDIGDLEQTEQFSIKALKLFTREQRKKGKLGQKYVEVEATSSDPNKKRRKSTKLSLEYRKSLQVAVSHEEFIPFSQQLQLMLSQQGEGKKRVKKKKPERIHPNVDGCYSSIFIPYGNKYTPKEIESILLEIAWCIYAAATARMGVRNMMSNDGMLITTQLCHEPFVGCKLTRPKGSLSSFFYNALAIGIMKKQKGITKTKYHKDDDDSDSSSASTPTKDTLSSSHNNNEHAESNSVPETNQSLATNASVQVQVLKKHKPNLNAHAKKKILKQPNKRNNRASTLFIDNETSSNAAPAFEALLSARSANSEGRGSVSDNGRGSFSDNVKGSPADSTEPLEPKKRRLNFKETVNVLYTNDEEQEDADEFYVVEEILNDSTEVPNT